jgi:hypothetical protein
VKLSINSSRAMRPGQKTYSGKTITADIAARHTRLVELSRTAPTRQLAQLHRARASRLIRDI